MTSTDMTPETNETVSTTASRFVQNVVRLAASPKTQIKAAKDAIALRYRLRQRQRELQDFCGKLERLTDKQLEILGFARGSLPFALEDLHKTYYRKRDEIEREFG